ncbi:MAG: hypothetical protein LBE78_04250 [Burkholderiaceae bacterium]|jgi:hypothetical protein|nr:hypothetical protein [Burkholderiaceae bacterium]
MKFSIRSIKEDDSSSKCEIVIGSFKEITPLFTDLWDVHLYKSQWNKALSSLVNGTVQRCMLVTDIRPPNISAGIVFWVLFKEGGDIFFQQRFLRERNASLINSPLDIEKYIAPRVQGTPEEHAMVSEWQLSIEDVCHFIKCFDEAR